MLQRVQGFDRPPEGEERPAQAVQAHGPAEDVILMPPQNPAQGGFAVGGAALRQKRQRLLYVVLPG